MITGRNGVRALVPAVLAVGLCVGVGGPVSGQEAPQSPLATAPSSPTVVATPGLDRPPVDRGVTVGGVDSGFEDPPLGEVSSQEPAPADPLARPAQIVVGGALLLGLAGGVGLYLTREGGSRP